MTRVEGSQKTKLFPKLDESLTLEVDNLGNYKVLCLQKEDIAKDVLRVFAEKLRDHRELESRWGVIQETHLKYFRGKDFVSFLKTHPELMDILTEADRSLSLEGIASVLLREILLVRCDSVEKTLQPGNKLPTWPKHLEIFPNQVFSETDAFYAWTFEKPRSLWQKIISFLLPVLMTLELCLFPQFRYQCKLLLLYSPFRLVVLTLCLLLFGLLLMLWLNYFDEHDEAARERLLEEIINNYNDSTMESKETTEEEVIKTQPDGMDLKFPKEDQACLEEFIQDELHCQHSYYPDIPGRGQELDFSGAYTYNI